MAAWLNKWLLSALAPLLLAAGSGFHIPASTAGENIHPFHVSVTEVNHNAAEKTLEISCKIFTDDFEKALAKNYKTKVDLINPPLKAAMDSLVKKYIFSHLVIRANGRPVRLQYLGFENDHEAAYAYIEVPDIPAVNRFEVSTTLMYDMFDDQMNIFHFIVNGNRKSTRVSYPDKEATVSF